MDNLSGVHMEYWEKIVILQLGGNPARSLSIRSSKDAARVLLKAWPVNEGKCYRRAVLSCSAAMHGRVPQDLAQWAFIVAAMEAALSFEIIDPFDQEIAAVCREMLGDIELPDGDGDSRECVEPPIQIQDDLTRPFWWPKRKASGRSAR